MSKIDWGKAEALLAECERDTRVGEHIFEISEAKDMGESKFGEGHWYDIKGTLETAGDAKASFNLSDPEPQLKLSKEELALMTGGARKSISLNIRMCQQLDEIYDTTPAELAKGANGAKFGVVTYKTRRDPITNKGEFIRVREFKALKDIGGDEDSETGGF